MKSFLGLLCLLPLRREQLPENKRVRRTHRHISLITIASVFLLSQICGSQPVIAQGVWSMDPKYGASGPAMNHLVLGIDQLENNDLHGARYNFLFVINMNDSMPQNALQARELRPVAYLNLGVVDTLEGNPSAAIKNFLTAIDLSPNYSEAYFNLGAVYYKLGNSKKAEEAFLKAIEIQPEYGRAHYSLGFLYFDQKKYDLAKLHAEKAAEYGVPFKTLKERLAKVGR
jgi:tetratricopeptide (TPR) repeat protein